MKFWDFWILFKSNQMEIIMERIVSTTNNKVATNTQIIAKHFGRNHNEIIHALHYLMGDCGTAFSKENFFTQEQSNLYWVTCAGFMVLSGLFLGTRNARTKITFYRRV